MHNSSEFLGQQFCVHKHRDKQADVSGGEAAIDGGGLPDSHRIATVASWAPDDLTEAGTSSGREGGPIWKGREDFDLIHWEPEGGGQPGSCRPKPPHPACYRPPAGERTRSVGLDRSARRQHPARVSELLSNPPAAAAQRAA